MKRFITTVLCLIVILLASSASIAQTNPYARVQEFVDDIIGEDFSTYSLKDMEAGRTLYAYAEAVAGNLDTVLVLYYLPEREIVAYDDDSGQHTNARFSFTFDTPGDYALMVTAYDESSAGTYRLLVGLDDPAVMWGIAQPAGSEFVETNRLSQTLTARNQPIPSGSTTELTGTLTGASQQFYDLNPLRSGQTIYLYAEATGDDSLDTYIAIGLTGASTIVAYDDDDGTGSDSLLAYRIPADGNYSIVVRGKGKASSGDFRLLIGIDNASILSGSTDENSNIIANAYRNDYEIIRGYECNTLEERPTFTGREKTIEHDYFIIHYTQTGDDAASMDYVAAVTEAVEYSLIHQTEDMGWAMPPPDCGEGGDERFDVYIKELASFDIRGSAIRERFIGDNPGTERTEIDAAYSYMIIDNDFDGIENPTGAMRSTVAHELSHNIQLGYDIDDAFFGLYEASAVWMVTQTYPEEDSFNRFIDTYYDTPDICIGNKLDNGSNLRMYGEWLLLESLVQDYGEKTVLSLWEALIKDEGLPGFYSALEDLGTTPQQAIVEAATRNLLQNYSENTNSHLAQRPVFSRDFVRVERYIDEPGTFQPTLNGIQELSVDYVRIASDDFYTFAIEDEAIHMRFVGIHDDEADIIDIGMRGAVDTSLYDMSYLILLNTTVHTHPSDCAYRPWSLHVSPGNQRLLKLVDRRDPVPSHFVPAS